MGVRISRREETTERRRTEGLAGLRSGPYRLEVKVYYSNRLIFERLLGRGMLTASRASFASLALAACLCLASGLALMTWRLGEVHSTLRHRAAMRRWANRHQEAEPFVPTLPSRPFLETTFIVLLGAGVAAGLMAAAERRWMRDRRRVTLGESAGCDLPFTSASLPADPFPLVEARGQGFSLNCPPAFHGEIELSGGRRVRLDGPSYTLRRTSHPTWTNTTVVDFPPLGRCWMEIGPMTFVIEDPTEHPRFS